MPLQILVQTAAGQLMMLDGVAAEHSVVAEAKAYSHFHQYLMMIEVSTSSLYRAASCHMMRKKSDGASLDGGMDLQVLRMKVHKEDCS